MSLAALERIALSRVGKLGRLVLWHCPAFYGPVAMLRQRLPRPYGNDIWVGGYPRSANTFMQKCLQRAFPDKILAAHLHMPPWVISELERKRPGILLVRAPGEAALSYAASFDVPVAESLDFYVHFHAVVWPYAKRAFVATFEQVVPDPSAMIERFAARYRLAAQKVILDTKGASDVFGEVDRMPAWTRPDGSVDEMRTARPSAPRRAATERLREELRHSEKLQRKLRKADALYQKF